MPTDVCNLKRPPAQPCLSGRTYSPRGQWSLLLRFPQCSLRGRVPSPHSPCPPNLLFLPTPPLFSCFLIPSHPASSLPPRVQALPSQEQQPLMGRKPWDPPCAQHPEHPWPDFAPRHLEWCPHWWAFEKLVKQWIRHPLRTPDLTFISVSFLSLAHWACPGAF